MGNPYQSIIHHRRVVLTFRKALHVPSSISSLMVFGYAQAYSII